MNRIIYFSIVFVVVFMSSCATSNISMKQPNNHIEFYKGDFEYSPQVVGEATSVKILMIDWARLFNSKTGDINGENSVASSEIANLLNVSTQFVENRYVGLFNAMIPVIGDFSKEKVNQYALYDMMKKNPGYDLVLYPQYETKKYAIPFLYSKTTVKAKARLGKIKD